MPILFRGFTFHKCLSDNCANHPCYNGASCNNGINSYNCVCVSGYTGIQCNTRVDVCATATCNGQCLADLNNKVVCICDKGYYGLYGVWFVWGVVGCSGMRWGVLRCGVVWWGMVSCCCVVWWNVSSFDAMEYVFKCLGL